MVKRVAAFTDTARRDNSYTERAEVHINLWKWENTPCRVATFLVADDGFTRQRALMAIQFGMQSPDSEAHKLDFGVIRENVGQVGFPEAWREIIEI